MLGGLGSSLALLSHPSSTCRKPCVTTVACCAMTGSSGGACAYVRVAFDFRFTTTSPHTHTEIRKVPATIATMITATMGFVSLVMVCSCWFGSDSAGVSVRSGVRASVRDGVGAGVGCGAGCDIVLDVGKGTGKGDGAVDNFGVVERGVGSGVVVDDVGVPAVGAGSRTSVGTSVRALVGDWGGRDCVGCNSGTCARAGVGTIVVGDCVGCCEDGTRVGAGVGGIVGDGVGCEVGTRVGAEVGGIVGDGVGCEVGSRDGASVGAIVGAGVGTIVGIGDGAGEGENVSTETESTLAEDIERRR